MTPDTLPLSRETLRNLTPDGALPMESQAAFDRWTMGRSRPGEHDRVVASLVLWMERTALNTPYHKLSEYWGKNRGTLYRCLDMVQEMLEEDTAFRYQAGQVLPSLKLVDEGLFASYA